MFNYFKHQSKIMNKINKIMKIYANLQVNYWKLNEKKSKKLKKILIMKQNKFRKILLYLILKKYYKENKFLKNQ